MLSELIARFFRRRKRPPKPEPPRVAVRVDGQLPDELPHGKIACVLRRRALVDVCRQRPPKALADNETCWLVPAADVPVEVTLQLGETPVAADVAVRFESDTQLAELLDGRTELTAEDLASLVTSELAGLLDLLGQQNPQELVDLDEESRERLRAKLSLLLQNNGLRATAVENIRLVPVVEEEEPAEEPEPELVEAELVEEPEEPAAEEVQRELAGAVEKVQSDAQWNHLMGQLEEAGFQTDEVAAAELDELGEKLVDREVNADQVADRIREMAEAAARKAEIPRPDLRRWQGLALRLRTAGQPAPSEGVVPAEGSKAAQEVQLDATRRPWTWWMLRRRSVDNTLRGFLETTIRESRTALEQYRQGLREIRHAGQVRQLDQQLQLVEDLLATVPTLAPPNRQLRVDRGRVKELVRSVERAVTAAEMLQGSVRKLIESQPGETQWEAAIKETSLAADTLSEHLRARRAVR